MTVTSALRRTGVLLSKNWLLKRRHPYGLAFELVIPLLFVALFSYLKDQADIIKVPEGWSSEWSSCLFSGGASSADCSEGTRFPLFNGYSGGAGYHGTEMSVRDLLVQLTRLPGQDEDTGSKLYSPDCSDYFHKGQVNPPPAGCDVIPSVLAVVVADEAIFELFAKTVSAWYAPIDVNQPSHQERIFPGIAPFLKWYASSKELDDYISGSLLGTAPKYPKIFAAIQFNSHPPMGRNGKWDYSVRLKARTWEGSYDFFGTIYGTLKPAMDFVAKGIVTEPMQAYLYGGHVTLQTLVDKFILCNPDPSSFVGSQLPRCLNSEATVKKPSSVELLVKELEEDRSFLSSLPMVTNVTSFLSSLDPDAVEALAAPSRQLPLSTSFFAYPVAAYKKASFYSMAANVLPLNFIMAYLYTVSKILIAFVRDKELKFRELTKIMGVSDSIIISSWYLTYGIFFFISSILMAIAMDMNLFPGAGVGNLFVLFFLFGLDVIAFCYFLSTFFAKGKTAAVVGVVFFFLSYMVYYTANADSSSSSAKLASCLLPSVALAQGISILSAFATNETSVVSREVVGNLSLGGVFGMMVLDFVLYTIFGAYLEQVLPKEWGVQQPWYFCFSPTYWFPKTKKKESGLTKPKVIGGGSEISPVEASPITSDTVEKPSADLRLQEKDGRCLRIEGLQKVFQTPVGLKTAVQDLDLSLYEGQITCLLGHNGAGKTTTISILSGMLEPTKGNAFYRGLSLTEDLEEIRKSMGVCPQHDVLYEDLTVKEHLHLFGAIKGLSGKALEEETMKKIREVGLTEKVNVNSSQLSGGMKRKLSLAIALIGDSKLVFLDEPTSGMDPYSRRSTWQVIQNNREGRIIILTTHFMDEADLLGDRIAIMAGGGLRCCGSSMFLKNRYGVGYNLTLVKSSSANTKGIQETIAKYVPSSKVLSNVGAEIAFQLPLEANTAFPKLLRELDAEPGVLSYGISVTTMEEVFLKVAEADHLPQASKTNKEKEEKTASGRPINNLPRSTFKIGDRKEGGYFLRHLGALFMKRLRYAKRDKQSLWCSTMMPILMLLIGFIILKTSSMGKPNPALALSPNMFGAKSTPAPIYCSPASSSSADADRSMCSSLVTRLQGVRPLELPLSPATSSVDNVEKAVVFGVPYDLSKLSPKEEVTLLFANTSFHEMRYKQKVPSYGSFVLFPNSSDGSTSAVIGVNTSAFHGAGVLQTTLHSSMYRAITGQDEVDILTTSHPLPLTKQSNAVFTAISAFTAVLFIIIAVSFIPANIITFVVKEKEATGNAKHLQLVSGASLAAYWLANFLWEFLVYLGTFASALILLQLFDVGVFTGSNCEGDECPPDSQPFGATALLFFLFGLAVVPATFLFSFCFKVHSVAQSMALFVAFIAGTGGVMATSIMDNIPSTMEASKALKYVLRLLPPYALGEGLLNMVTTELWGAATNEEGETKKSVFHWDITGGALVYMAFTPFLYIALTIAMDYLLCSEVARAWFPFSRRGAATTDATASTMEEDSDVAAERQRVTQGAAFNDIVRLEGVRKVYNGGKVAVKNLSFGLPAGACFGFLGINGAGKSTTMKLLTGDEMITSGQAFIGGRSVTSDQMGVRRLIGYCPQFDALLDLLTVREHLELFAAIKGVPPEEVELVVRETLVDMDLTNFEHKLTHTLSGGNKRKLSVGIAMIGSPPVLFLDEPSTGMDPVARRFMWSVIARVSTETKESTVVLTTHSMEECEALCSTVGIMVGGRLRCLGSIQHLKDKFGNALMLELKASDPPQGEVEALMNQLQKELLSASEVFELCTTLGKPSRISLLQGGASQLQGQLSREGKVPVTLFCTWWINQNNFELLADRLERILPGIQLLERHDLKSRWRIEKGGKKLAYIFEAIEDLKKDIAIPEYCVSQVSLEQVFNQFAAQQDEEKALAPGMILGAEASR